MYRKFKTPLILSSLAILAPGLVQILLGREAFPSLLMPLVFLGGHWLAIFLTFRDNRERSQSQKALNMTLWIVPLISLFLSAVDYCLVNQIPFPSSSVPGAMMGLMFLILGNYLPTVRPNSTLGIKIWWTFTSEENWNATHRFAGKVWVAGGIALLLGLFLPEKAAIGWMMLWLAGLCILPMLYSWAYYRRQVKRGDPLTFPMQGILGRKGSTLSLFFTAGICGFVILMLFTGTIEYRFEEEYLVVEASYHDDLVLFYDRIDSAQLRQDVETGTRVWGFGSPRLLMGTFDNAEFGTYTRYSYTRAQSSIVLTSGSQTYVLSGKTPEDTQALYEALAEITN